MKTTGWILLLLLCVLSGCQELPAPKTQTPVIHAQSLLITTDSRGNMTVFPYEIHTP